MEILFIIGVVWVICGILAYGLTLNEFESQFPFFTGNTSIAWFLGLTGPFGLITALLSHDVPLGLRFREIPIEEKHRLHKKKWSSLEVDF